MAPTGSKCRLSLSVGVQYPSSLLFYVNEESKGEIIIYERSVELLTILVNILNNFILFQNKTYILSPNKDFYYNRMSVLDCPVTVNNTGGDFYFYFYLFIFFALYG